MTLTLSDSTALAVASAMLNNSRERALALATAVTAQRAINDNPASDGSGARSSLVQFPLQDAEVLADAVLKAARLCGEKVLEF